ncbi:MAG: hypothetical protein SW833_08895 [Cyanobacteriota bacterium]|nr:hypothetical protein [Cyanobacteriota bacterium]
MTLQLGSQAYYPIESDSQSDRLHLKLENVELQIPTKDFEKVEREYEWNNEQR